MGFPPLAGNGRSFALIGFCKRLVCANLRKGCVSWCVSLWAGSVCFCSFLRKKGKIIDLIYSKLHNN